MARRCPMTGLLHHSDQGCTYASEGYQRMLDANGITCSMSRRGKLLRLAVMEALTGRRVMSESFPSEHERPRELADYTERLFAHDMAAIFRIGLKQVYKLDA